MLRVIDTINYDDILLRVRRDFADRIRNLPGVAERFGRSVLVILDPSQVSSAPVQPGATVRVYRPDGGTTDLVVSAVDVCDSVVALFFSDAGEHGIDRLSMIKVVAA